MSTNETGCVGQESFVNWSTLCNFLLIHEFLNDIRQEVLELAPYRVSLFLNKIRSP